MEKDFIKKFRSVFDKKSGFYPSFSSFSNALRDMDTTVTKVEYKKEFKDMKEFYFSQELVQVFQPPPKENALKHEEGYYPKIISFYPFERLYADSGKIIMYSMTRAETKKKVEAPVVSTEGKISFENEDNLRSQLSSFKKADLQKYGKSFYNMTKYQKPPNNSKEKTISMLIDEIVEAEKKLGNL